MIEQTFIPVSTEQRFKDMNLSKEDRSMLKFFAEKEPDFIDNPIFKDESNFPDPIPEVVPSVEWVDSIDDLDKKKNRKQIVLTKKNEKQLFLRYNFYRRNLWLIWLDWDARDKAYMTDRDIRRLLNDMKRIKDIEERIASFNIGLAFSMAKRNYDISRNMSAEQLRSECRIAMFRSIRKFNAGLDFKFSTYACRSMITSMTRENSREQKIENRFRPISTYSSDETRQKYLINETSISFDKEHGEDEQNKFNMELIESYLDHDLDWGYYTLTENEIEAIRMRFDPQGRSRDRHNLITYDIIGKKMGVPKERIRKYINRGLEKIRCMIEDEFDEIKLQRPKFSPDLRSMDLSRSRKEIKKKSTFAISKRDGENRKPITIPKIVEKKVPWTIS